MGSTLVSFILRGHLLQWISVGDSPLYLFRDGSLRLLNRLHSLVGDLEEAIRNGEIDAEEGKRVISKMNRNILTAALTGEELRTVDDSPVMPVQPGDVILAASDGVNTLDDDELAQAIAGSGSRSAAAIAEAILDAVKGKGRSTQDNATVVVVRVPPTP
jgi:serine/threonine protein phosphatase PrpC